MKRSPAIFTLSTLALTLGIGTSAKAQDELALSFDLPVMEEESAQVEPAATPEAAPASTSAPEPHPDAPLPIPPGAENPPIAGDTTRPAGVYGGSEALALHTGQLAQGLLPAPPPAPTIAVAQVVALIPEAAPPTEHPEPVKAAPEDISIFAKLRPFDAKEEKDSPAGDSSAAVASNPAKQVKRFDFITSIFQGGTESLVAKAVGSAEGTRTPEGHKTPAYFGHKDPGNGVWNMGTFSYQHGATSPEEADSKQLERLKSQTLLLKEKARAYNIELTAEELLNGIDLANQAPLAALDRGGYIDWLNKARNELNMTGAEAIVYARTRAFIDPDTQRWNAPGLGNNLYSISHDQERRANAIARALAANPIENFSIEHAATETVAFNQDAQTVLETADCISKTPSLDFGLSQSCNNLNQAAPTNLADNPAATPLSVAETVAVETSALAQEQEVSFAEDTLTEAQLPTAAGSDPTSGSLTMATNPPPTTPELQPSAPMADETTSSPGEVDTNHDSPSAEATATAVNPSEPIALPAKAETDAITPNAEPAASGEAAIEASAVADKSEAPLAVDQTTEDAEILEQPAAAEDIAAAAAEPEAAIPEAFPQPVVLLPQPSAAPAKALPAKVEQQLPAARKIAEGLMPSDAQLDAALKHLPELPFPSLHLDKKN